jgi:ubiquitin carboxyl-terminal hydrolase 6/32
MQVVAAECWQGHVKRNQSVVVDLMHGQIRSQVRCQECEFTSVAFDPFTFLTLPLPTESYSVVVSFLK